MTSLVSPLSQSATLPLAILQADHTVKITSEDRVNQSALQNDGKPNLLPQ